MAVGDPTQWIVIGVVLIVIFLWGPNKIPELARSLGQAKREFDRAQKELGTQTDSFLRSVSGPAPQGVRPNQQQPQASSDEVLIRTARALGIVTDGKTREQISDEIIARASQRGPSEAK